MSELKAMLEQHYSLDEAADRFFPGGRITGRSLRTEIERGRLPRKKIAGKLVTCESDLALMVKRCQDEESRPVSISASREVTAVPVGSSLMERKRSAQAVLQKTSRAQAMP
jgi:hypothetical protein